MANKRDICVIGIGRYGQSIVEQLIELRKSVLALDISETKLVRVARITNTAIVDGSDIEGLRALGLEKFSTVIVAASENIEIVASLIELGVKHIIAKAKSTSHERVLRQIGVDVIVKPEVEAGVRTALIATNSTFIKYSELLQEVGDGYAIGSTVVSDMHYINRPLSQLKLSKLGVSVVSIKRNLKVVIPNGETRLKNGDSITLIGKVPNLTKTFAELNDEGSTRMLKLTKIEAAKNKANAIRSKK
ncbi:MAG: TrkA family potassium uptake protein [Mycoplasmataceae bacterium]|nr:TrkA family potassium uptake protein [Mycoplasmataceae bacterium]